METLGWLVGIGCVVAGTLGLMFNFLYFWTGPDSREPGKVDKFGFRSDEEYPGLKRWIYILLWGVVIILLLLGAGSKVTF